MIKEREDHELGNVLAINIDQTQNVKESQWTSQEVKFNSFLYSLAPRLIETFILIMDKALS